MKKNKAVGTWLIFSCVLALVLGACTKKQTVKKSSEADTAKMEENAASVQDDVASEELGVPQPELDTHGKAFVGTEELAAIHFDYDSAELSDQVRRILSANADYLKQNPKHEIVVEGHCDQRGTVGYNLALGQKRAITVRKYYISLGIEPKRIGTLSFGKERLFCGENSEECWLKNRRAETKVTATRISSLSESEDQ